MLSRYRSHLTMKAEGGTPRPNTEDLDPATAEAPTLAFDGNNPMHFVSGRSPFMSGLGHFATETS